MVVALAQAGREVELFAMSGLPATEDPDATAGAREQAERPIREAEEQALEAGRRMRGDHRGVQGGGINEGAGSRAVHRNRWD